MRICLISNYADSHDEGMMNVAFHLGEGLSKSHELVHVNARTSIFSNSFWRSLRTFNPHIIHVILRPSSATLVLVKALKRYCKHAKILISALQPPKSSLGLKLFSMLKPDMVLVQSLENERIFSVLGYKTALFPNGVDTKKFLPASNESKIELRKKYSIASNKFVILHVGHLLKGRNLEMLSSLQKEDNQIIIVGSTVFKSDKKIQKKLESDGCIIWRKHFANIEEIYALSDCYIFPTVNKSNSIELPLSVIEAMSCNLPVICSNFGGLPNFFQEGDGLFYVTENEDLYSKLKKIRGKIKNNSTSAETRKKVISYSWENVVTKLEIAYMNILAS